MFYITTLNVGRPNSYQHVFLQSYYKSMMLYCRKSRSFKLVYLKNNLYSQKVHKKGTYKTLLTVTVVFQAVFEVLLLQDGKKS